MEPQIAEAENTAQALIPSMSIDTLLQRRADAEKRLHEAQRLVCEASDLLAACLGEVGDYERADLARAIDRARRDKYRDIGGDGWVEYVMTVIDKQLWNGAIEKLGVVSLMDATARKEFYDNVESGNAPSMNKKNLAATLEALHSQSGLMFERGVVAVFKALTWDYKTNRYAAFGKRIILSNLVDRNGYISSYCDKSSLNDLERCLTILDGKPAPTYALSAERKLQKAHVSGDRALDLSYFRLVWFKNGNGHLTFTDSRLVDEMNRILSKHHPDALPPSPTATHR